MKKLPQSDTLEIINDSQEPVEVAKPHHQHPHKHSEPSPDPLVTFNNVTKAYPGGCTPIDDVSFTIGKGEFIFLIGKSGAGKSTLVKLLIREQNPTSGSIIFDNVDIVAIPHKEIHQMRRRVGVVFQDFKVLNSRNVFDNVAIALEVVDAPKSQITEVVNNVLTLVGLLDKAGSFPPELSGGELQRVAIARALAHEPDLLVADEPTGNIDPAASQQVINIFEKINKMGVAILMATHDDRVVDRLKKRVIKLENGRVVSDEKEGKYVQSDK